MGSEDTGTPQDSAVMGSRQRGQGALLFMVLRPFSLANSNILKGRDAWFVVLVPLYYLMLILSDLKDCSNSAGK